MPPATVAATARLAAMSGPLGSGRRQPATSSAPAGGARTVSPASPLAGAAGSTAPGAGFPTMLAEQLGLSGSPSNTGKGAAGAASRNNLLDGFMDSAKGSSLGSALASPQMARAVAAAKNATGAAAPASGTASSKAQKALAWAKSKLGSQEWNNLCERFVEEAYGTRGVYPTAKDASDAIVKHKGQASLKTAPPGALLYFAADETNENNGHAGIYLGNGQMISARPGGVSIERLDTPYNRQRFLGWGNAPASFPGTPPGHGSSAAQAGRTAVPSSLASGAAATKNASGTTATAPSRSSSPASPASPPLPNVTAGGVSSAPRSASRPGASLMPGLPALPAMPGRAR